MSPKVAIIFGYGPNVGTAIANTLTQKGYTIAIVSRSPTHHDTTKPYLSIQADLSDPTSIQPIFSKVIHQLGHPSVVIYNASANTTTQSQTLEDQISSFQSDNNVNIISAHIAAHLAIQSFAALPGAANTFIYTGNKLNLMVARPLLSHGVGKAGAAHLMHYLAEQYKHKGYRFYYADERRDDGSPVYGDIDGGAHGEFYGELVDGEGGPWLATFVKGRGYVSFEEGIVNEAVVMK